jgi:hypothetical protein
MHLKYEEYVHKATLTILTLTVRYSVLFLTLGRLNQHAKTTTYSPIHTGCSTHVPAACAKIPVVNGATAPPELPAPPINPIAVV